jgi:hypothetical protein
MFKQAKAPGDDMSPGEHAASSPGPADVSVSQKLPVVLAVFLPGLDNDGSV